MRDMHILIAAFISACEGDKSVWSKISHGEVITEHNFFT